MRKLKQGVFALLILALATFIGACETEIHDEGVSAPLSSSTKEQSSRLESEALSCSTEETFSSESELSVEESDASSEEIVLPEDNFSDSLEESESSSETSEDAPTSSPAESSSDGRFELPEDKFN
ncbi:MAG: hypothetical protein J6A63_00840 [Clostridia bacterium]|nr:hypothetical protein [Clostridia bacterium]